MAQESEAVRELERLKGAIEDCIDHLGAKQCEEARLAIDGVSDHTDCPLCERVETQLLAGVIFIGTLNDKHAAEVRAILTEIGQGYIDQLDQELHEASNQQEVE